MSRHHDHDRAEDAGPGRERQTPKRRRNRGRDEDPADWWLPPEQRGDAPSNYWDRAEDWKRPDDEDDDR